MAFIAGAPDFSIGQSLGIALSYHSIALGGAHQSGNVNEQHDLATIGNEMITLLKEKKISSLLKHTISLEHVSEKLVELSNRHVTGKIVVRIK